MADRVQEILSWYSSDNAGTKTNIARLLRHGKLAGTGKLVILPVDQGFEHGPARSFAVNPGGYNPLYVHIKGPDVPAHDGRSEDKRDVIAAIDAGFFSEIMRTIDPSSTIVAVTADHSTSCVRRAHTSDPVPLVVSGGGVTADGSQRFGERACASGSLGQMLGVAVLPLLARLAAD